MTKEEIEINIKFGKKTSKLLKDEILPLVRESNKNFASVSDEKILTLLINEYIKGIVRQNIRLD